MSPKDACFGKIGCDPTRATGSRSASAFELVGDVAEGRQPGDVAGAPVATEANEHGVGVGSDVDVLTVLSQGVEAPRPLDVEPPEVPVAVVVRRVGGRVGAGRRAYPVLGDDSSAVPLAIVEEEQPEAGVVGRPGV